MEIWQLNDPKPLRPFFRVLQGRAPHLAESGRRLLSRNAEATSKDLACLAQGLVDRSDTVREAVQILIFSPPVEDELGHFRRLLRWFPTWLPSGWEKHLALRRLVAELASCLDGPQSCAPLATTLQVALKKRFNPRREETAHFSNLWKQQYRRGILSILARRLPFPIKPSLKRRILESTDLSVGHIYETIAAANRLTPMGAYRRWRKMEQLADVSRASVVDLGTSHPQKRFLKSDGDLRILSWGERRPEEIAYLERLIDYQSNELVEVYKLAKEVSRRTRRVVLTLHNASLGAATGWGITSFAQQVSDDTSADFVQRANHLRRDFAEDLCQSGQLDPTCHNHSLGGRVNDLLLLWGKRLARGRLLQDLWALKVSLFLNDLPTEDWQQACSQAGVLLDADDYRHVIQGTRLAVTFAPPALSRHRLGQTLFWYLDGKRRLASLLSLLWSLIAAGEEWLHTERTLYFVLPLIDKFFISSRRDQDLEYLPRFVQLASVNGHAPLFLLIDDTSRAENPSLKLAMEHWRPKHPFRGLGVFAGDADYIGPPLETILARSDQTSLFALRPMTQINNPVSFETLLTQRPNDFLTPEKYDSSWKDNLPFLYHGTQVAPLAGPADPSNQFSPALMTSAGPMAFGVYYSGRLRQLALARLGLSGARKKANRALRPLEALWHEYSKLANLL